MGLETYDQNTPIGTSTLSQGDNKMRELAQKTCASIAAEHNLNGKHNFPHGSLGQRPAAGNTGRLYIVDDPISGTVYIQYDNGSSWVTVVAVSSSGLTIEQATAAYNTHVTTVPIDHPDGSITETKLNIGSVTNPKIASGALRKVHFDPSHTDPQGEVSALVDGSELGPTWHTHTSGGGGGGGSSGITFLSSFLTVASGVGTVSWTNLDLTSSGVPDTAIGVILQGVGAYSLDTTIIQDKSPLINFRKNSSSDSVHITGSRFKHDVIVGTIDALEDRGQAMGPIDTGAKIQYKAEGYNISWEIKLIGYIE